MIGLRFWVGIVFGLVWTSVVGAESDMEAQRFWPQWRGPNGTGVALLGDPPVRWDEETHIRWKVEIPGQGHGSPIVWGDRVFVLTAVATDQPVDPEALAKAQNRTHSGRTSEVTPSRVVQFTVLALSRQDGRIVWQQVAREAIPHEGHHSDGTWASHSPVTDGEYLYAFFGSNGLFCYDISEGSGVSGRTEWDDGGNSTWGSV